MRLIEIAIVAAFGAVGLFWLPRLIIKQDIKNLKFLSAELIIQNFVCIAAADLMGSGISQFIILYKEIAMYGAIALSLVVKKKCKLRVSTLPVVIAIVVFLPYFFIGDASLYTRLICFRQLLTPFVLMLYGGLFKLSKDKIHDYLRFLVNLALIQAIFGIIERFMLGDGFWFSLHIEKYMGSKGFNAWVYNNGLPGNFYSADLYQYVGMLRRLVGLTADPLLTGHSIAIGLIILIFVDVYKSSLKKYSVMFILTIAVVLTLSKGAILIIGIAYIYKVWKKNKIIAVGLALMAIAVAIVLITQNAFSTIAIHLSGLTTSFGNILGKGLGSSGNYATLYGGESATSGESYIGTLIGQMGLIGLLTFIYAITTYSRKILTINKNKIGFLVVAIVLAVLTESFLSESAINFVGTGTAFILLGILSKNKVDIIRVSKNYDETKAKSIQVNFKRDFYEL